MAFDAKENIETNLNVDMDIETNVDSKTDDVSKTRKFLNKEELIVAYLNELLSEGNAEEFLLALNKFLSLKGMTDFAAEKGLIDKNGINPKVSLESVTEILNTLGLKLVFNGQKA